MSSHLSSVILVSTIIPLIKDKLGDISSSNNYRSVALSSLLLKNFDWIILLLHGDKLSTDELQFGYQQNTSTNMCTWLAIETIDYFLRNGSEVFVGVMEMSKAFDNVKQSVLFWKLIDKDIPPIYLRLLLNIYIKQRANVRWNGTLSDSFPIGNGVKQGGVLSPHLYCIYTDDLFRRLRKKRTGCWVEGKFVGIRGTLTICFSSHPASMDCKRWLNHVKTMLEVSTYLLARMWIWWNVKRNVWHFSIRNVNWKTSHWMGRICLR